MRGFLPIFFLRGWQIYWISPSEDAARTCNGLASGLGNGRKRPFWIDRCLAEEQALRPEREPSKLSGR
jgi:hypothetical protein